MTGELPDFTPIHASLTPMVELAVRTSAAVQSLSPLIVVIAAAMLLLLVGLMWLSMRSRSRRHSTALESLVVELRVQFQYFGALFTGLESKGEEQRKLVEQAESRLVDRLTEYKHDLALLNGALGNRLANIQAGIAEHTARQAAVEGRVAEHNEHLSAIEARMGEHGAHLSAIRAGGGGLHMG